MKKALIEFYFDWMNNFLTIQVMADHYEMEVDDCKKLVQMGYEYHLQVRINPHHYKTICQ